MSRTIIFLTVFGSLMLFVDVYFWQAFRIKFFNTGRNEQLIKWLYWGFSILWMILLAYSMMQYNAKNPAKILTPIRGIAFALFFGKLIGIAPLLVDDVFRLFRWGAKLTGNPIIQSDQTGGINRLEFLQKSALGLGGLMFGAMTYGVAFGRFNFKKHIVKMKLKNWPEQLDGLKAIQISDIHLGSFTSTDPIKDVVKMINQENPDFIFFTGDLVNSFAWEAEPFIEELSKLEARYGKYSVLGNHDYADYAGLRKDIPEDRQKWQDNHIRMLEIHKEMGFDLLLNENRVIEINGGKFNIAGVENWGAGGFAKYGDLDKSLEGLNHDLPTILLSHDPSALHIKILYTLYAYSLK